ncbi:MAG: nucleotide exchange factor GrpE [Candidatus Riflebacteria bacterium]|nr:nucleotide exchange factor GrpE [Candidatus Riflebacteria bacterium]
MNPGEDKAEFSLSSEFFKKLNQQIVQKDNLIKLLQLQIKNLKAQLEDGGGDGPKKADLVKALEAKETETKSLESELTSQKEQLASALHEKDAQIQALNRAIEEQQKTASHEPVPMEDPRVPELQASIARLEEELAAEHQKVASAEEAISAEKSNAAAMAQLQSNLETELAGVRARLEEAEAFAKTAAAQPEPAPVTEPSPELTARIAELEAEIVSLQTSLSQKDEQITALSSAGIGAPEPDGGLVSELSDVKAELEMLRSKSSEEAVRASELESALATSQVEAAKVASLEAKIRNLEAEGLDMTETAMKLTALESERERLAVEVQTLRAAQESSNAEIASLTSSLASVSNADSEISARDLEIAALKAVQATNMVSMAELKGTLAVTLEEVAHYKAAAEAKSSHAADADIAMKAEVDLLTGQVADQLLAIQKFEQVLRQTQEEVTRRDEEIALLQKRLGENSSSGKSILFSSDSEVLTHFIDFFDGLDSFLLQNQIPELQVLHKQLLDRLILPNQIEYMPVISEEFNPTRHVATDYFRSDRFADKMIVFEVEKGYRRGDSVVKKSKVWVVQNLFSCPSCNVMQTNADSRFCHLCGAKIVAPNGLPVDSLPTFEPTPATYLRFADRMIEESRYSEARIYLEDGLSLDGEFVPILVRLADVHGFASEFSKAVEVLQKAVALKPDPKLVERIHALEVKNTISKQAKSLNLPPGEFDKLMKLIQE